MLTTDIIIIISKDNIKKILCERKNKRFEIIFTLQVMNY